MKDHPILFRADMVRAILDGRKTQTRRIIKPRNQPSIFVGSDYEFVLNTENKELVFSECPYGRPSDRLWVRETWLPAAWDAEEGMVKFMYRDYSKSKWIQPYQNDYLGEKFNKLWMSICDELDRKGIEADEDGMYHFNSAQHPLAWRPSIHMPRAAARIILEITDVRVQRLQDITEADAIAEGIVPSKYDPRIQFKILWEKINGSNSWAANPCVWAITFERI